MALNKPVKSPASKSAVPESVEAFLATFDHPAKAAILALRQIILEADPAIAEGIKWNVPSFRTSEYFATLNLRAKTGIGIILHFGAKKGAIATTGVAIPDPTSMLVWLGKDRATVSFRDLEDVEARRSDFTMLLQAWITHVGT